MQANTGEFLVDMFVFVMHTVKQYNPTGAIKQARVYFIISPVTILQNTRSKKPFFASHGLAC